MMPYPADYNDAHCRHWQDAELLRVHRRWANADQLYGFSAECGLKAVMQALGMPVDDTGRPQADEHRKHVQALWPVFLSFAVENDGAHFATLLPVTNPFGDWSHHDRYAASRHFGSDRVEVHREAALRVCEMVTRATRDGLL